jgi:ribosomal protein L11 methyltransferase
LTEEARTTLTVGNLTFKAAETLADEMDEHPLCDALAVTLNETDEQAALWNVVAFFTDAEKAEAARNALKLQKAEITDLVQRDWVKESLEGLAPVAAGRFFLYGGHDRERRRGGGISLLIDAGTAFGTGHHGTTEGCLLALDSILKRTRPRHMLDLGCGTGVLALAAAKATHTKVLASDIDPEAVRVTRLNGAINGAGPLLACVTAPGLAHRLIAESAPFDLIFANILARPLVSLAWSGRAALSSCLD